MGSIFGPGRMNRYNSQDGSGSKPPEEAGLYYIRDKDKNVQYIGLTNNLRKRERQHEKTQKINEDRPYFDYHVANDGISYDDLRREERRKIRKYNPPLNRSHGGEGRPTNNVKGRTVSGMPDYSIPVEEPKSKKFGRFIKRLLLVVGIAVVVFVIAYLVFR